MSHAVEPVVDGEVLVLSVGELVHGGACLARAADGQVVFVRHALPGERVRAVVSESRRGYLRADAVEIIDASPDRVSPPCRYAGVCGGCDLQHVAPAAARELKAAVVREQLRRLGGLAPNEVDALEITVAAVDGVPGQGEGLGWRTRVSYTVDSAGRAGLLRQRSHEVVPIEVCLIADPAIQASDALVRSWPDMSIVELVAGSSGRMSVLGVPAAGSGGGRRGQRPSPRLLTGPPEVTERALGRQWHLAPEVFWQVHPAAAETLAAAVVALLEPRQGERAWDLYGGAGLFAAALAPHLGATGRMTVVESDPAAVAAARRNLADLTTVTVRAGEVAAVLANPRWRGVDLVVADPPRTGLGAEVVAAIVARVPRSVAYVACDPAALARDTRTFAAAGYRLVRLLAYDLFPMTHHVECVALLCPEAGG